MKLQTNLLGKFGNTITNLASISSVTIMKGSKEKRIIHEIEHNLSGAFKHSKDNITGIGEDYYSHESLGLSSNSNPTKDRDNLRSFINEAQNRTTIKNK